MIRVLNSSQRIALRDYNYKELLLTRRLINQILQLRCRRSRNSFSLKNKNSLSDFEAPLNYLRTESIRINTNSTKTYSNENKKEPSTRTIRCRKNNFPPTCQRFFAFPLFPCSVMILLFVMRARASPSV